MRKRLFGTDGIRGVAGQFPLDARTVHAFGVALGEWAAGSSPHPEVLVGTDTRESGPWLAALVAGGLSRSGVRTRYAGLMTTPGVAYLTRTDDFVAGVMISASHNPFYDNGLKVFDHSGFKLPDADELKLEAAIARLLDSGVEPLELPLSVDEGLDSQYLAYLISLFPHRLDGVRMVVDCAHGAASQLAPQLFRSVGAEVFSIGTEPNGRNINLDCGALHTAALRTEVLQRRAALGVAFDGDADRAIFVAPSGKVVDGDGVLFVAGVALKAEDRLPGDLVVATVMSNIGLELAFRERGIRLVRTAVGDRYVLEAMLKHGAILGGEQSGHVIFRDCSTTGDGLVTALRILDIIARTGKTLDELIAGLPVFPQTLTNVRVRSRRPLSEMASVQSLVQAAETEFGGAGRVLVRFSGTEPLVRVMVEGPDPTKVQFWADKIAAAIAAELDG